MRVVSGGQTGADRGGLEAAIALGLPHGGWCPKGRRAEDGRIPRRFRLRETASAEYAVRTERNVVASDGTAVFTVGRATGGTALTMRIARRHRRPLVRIDLARDRRPAEKLRRWIERHAIVVLNVAGPRESGAPGIEARVKRIVMEALR